MIIGILKEKPYERRVVMQPDTVGALIKKGVKVLVEHNAGQSAFFANEAYQEVARITDYNEVLEKSDILIRISTPDDDLLGRMRTDQILISVLNPLCNMNLVNKVLDKKLHLVDHFVLGRQFEIARFPFFVEGCALTYLKRAQPDEVRVANFVQHPSCFNCMLL